MVLQRLFAGVLVTVFMAFPAAADPACKMQLQRIAKLDMGTDPGGSVLVPMTFGGKPVQMLVDTGGIFSSLTQESVTALGLTSRKIVGNPSDYIGTMPQRFAMQLYGGAMIDRVATARDVQLGAMKADKREFYVIPVGQLPDEDGGLLAPDILRAFDLDFDFANATLSLFSQDHCEGHVVYWTSSAAARVGITVDKYGHITVPVKVDGKTVLAVVDTGADRTTMSWEGTRHLFQLDEADPSLKKIDKNEYHYPFEKLEVEGMTINHPDIQLISDDASKIVGSDIHMLLGMNVLRQLHLYIAYKEGALYITPASAH